MIDLPDNSIDSAAQSAVTHADNLLRHYSFEFEIAIEQQLVAWLKTYPAPWILLAVVEALYQGRYKAVSVEQIMQIWQRRGQPVCHFTHEFEQLVGSKIPAAIAPPANPKSQLNPLPQPTLSYRTMLLQLPSVKAAFKLKRLTEIPSLTFPLSGTEVSRQSQQQSAHRAVSSLIHLALPAVAELTSTQSTDSEAIASQSNEFESTSKSRLVGDSDREFEQFKAGIIFALSSGLANPTLHPTIRLQLSQYYRLNWHHFLESQAPCM